MTDNVGAAGVGPTFSRREQSGAWRQRSQRDSDSRAGVAVLDCATSPAYVASASATFWSLALRSLPRSKPRSTSS